MAKPRSKSLDLLVYLAIRVGVCLVQALPTNLAWDLADFLGWLAFQVDCRHRAVALANVRASFPGLAEREVGALVRRSFRHLATLLVEITLMPRKVRSSTVGRYVRYANPGDYDRAAAWLRSGRPLLVVTGHWGNWEMFSYVCGLAGYRGSVVARRIDNRFLGRFLERFRTATGQTLLDKNMDYERITATLAKGRTLGLLCDQDAGRRGVFVNFFGRRASTNKSIALLSLRFSAPILVLGASRRRSPLHYDLHLEDAILPEEFIQQKDAVCQITQRYTAALERMVRKHPEQYFWLHRRWKHQPMVRKSSRARAA